MGSRAQHLWIDHRLVHGCYKTFRQHLVYCNHSSVVSLVSITGYVDRADSNHAASKLTTLSLYPMALCACYAHLNDYILLEHDYHYDWKYVWQSP